MIWAFVIFIYLLIGFLLSCAYYLVSGKAVDIVYKRLLFNWPCQDDTIRFIWGELWKK